MKNHLRALLASTALLATGGQSYANFSMSPSGTTTAFAIDAANQGTSLCAAASTECPAAVPVNTAGAPLFTTAVPGFVTQLAPNSTNLATWTSASGTQNIDIPVSGNFPSTLITLDNTAVTGGVVTIRGLKPNGSYETIGIAQIVNKSQFFNLNNPYTLPIGGATGALAQDFLVGNQGYSAINVQLSTAITGAGTLVVSYRLLPYSPLEWALLNPLVAGTAILGKFGIDQTTPGTTNGVAIAQDSGTVTGATPTVAGTTASNLVAKASAGNLQNLYVDSSAAGWVFVINATSLPANATLTIGTASGNLQDCFELPKANTEWVGSMNYNPGPWSHYSVGITVAISNTSCPVLTAASTGKFIHAQAN